MQFYHKILDQFSASQGTDSFTKKLHNFKASRSNLVFKSTKQQFELRGQSFRELKKR
jgi:hypothetical protein